MIKNIVIADDDPTTAYLLARGLENYGYAVISANNGRKALEIIKTRPVDLLITDVVMPEMDGVDLYMALKENAETANLPVIIVTDKEVFQESFAALGVELYCPKPFNMQLLLEKIKRVEARVIEGRRFRKVVVIGPDSEVLEKMRGMLSEKSCIVAMVDNVVEIGLRCFLTNPSLILIDIHTREYATTKEVVRSLRSFEFFKHTTIAIYSNFFAGDASVISGLDSLDEEIHSCLAAGANKYIGRFNMVTFLDQLKEFGI
jgi:CheY-like chemotaxis protein